MARGKDTHNGRLEEALAMLIQNQASFLARVSNMDERFAKIDERFVKLDERLSRIENVLIRHEHLLQALPEAVREKIGFKPPG